MGFIGVLRFVEAIILKISLICLFSPIPEKPRVMARYTAPYLIGMSAAGSYLRGITKYGIRVNRCLGFKKISTHLGSPLSPLTWVSMGRLAAENLDRAEASIL